MRARRAHVFPKTLRRKPSSLPPCGQRPRSEGWPTSGITQIAKKESDVIFEEKEAWFRHSKQIVRIVVLALVAWGIWRAVSQARGEFARHAFAIWRVDPGWLVAGGTAYALGLAPCWVFWQRTLRAMGQHPRWRDSLTAYWIGNLGKYVPGKAMVVVLRTGLVRGPQVDTTVAATSVFVETLTFMAIGALVSAVILLVTSQNPLMLLLAVALMVCAGVPTLPPVFRRVVRWLQVRRANPDIDRAIDGLNLRLLASGWASIAVGWLLLGVSLLATLRAMPAAGIPVDVPWTDLPLLTASVGLAMVAGFLSLVPGGLGVRDWILMTLMVPRYGAAAAVVSAVLLRVVWMLCELLISGILYVDRRWWRTDSGLG